MQIEKVNICNVYINDVSFEDVFMQIETYIKEGFAKMIFTPNVDHVVRLYRDISFRDAYKNASLVLVDSMLIIWASKILSTPLKEKLSGSDLFPKICQIASVKGYKMFYLGGKKGATEKSAAILQNKYPTLRVVGTYCPPFGFENDVEENKKIIELIKAAKPDILFVGVGSPKQEKWIYQHKDEYQVPVSIGIGAAFDFVSGMVKRAPIWMQKTGLEWFWRLMMEPKRLWKRYLIDDPVFFWLVLKQKLGLLN